MIVTRADIRTPWRLRTVVFVCVVILLLGIGPIALAEEVGDPFVGLVPADVQTLSGAQGRADDELSLSELGASVVGNSVSGSVTTGGAMISGDAFSDLNGVSAVLVNSGNNVSIQSSTVVNIVIYE